MTAPAPTVPARMSFEDCARSASLAHVRVAERPRPAVARRSLFKGAEISRLTLDWSAGLQPADDELRWSISRLRARARELVRNNAYARAYLRLLVDNVIGPSGVKHQAQVRNNDDELYDRFNTRIEEAWREWSRDVTIGTPMSLVDFSGQTIKTIAADGEAIIRHWRAYPNRYSYALEAIGPDQLDEELNRAPGTRDNEIRMGVEFDDHGRPVAYHVWDSPRSAMVNPDRHRVRIPANQIIHLYDPERVNQSRGLTWFGAAMFPLKMLDGYEEAELVASRVAASKMGFFVQKNEASGPPLVTEGDQPIEMEANPGTFETMPPGYELQTFDAAHPGQQFAEFVKTQLRKIATSLGISYNVLANDLEGVNYSSMRSGLLSERDTWRRLQQWWIAAFLRPVYAEWMNMALLSGALVLDKRPFERLIEAKWTPRGWPWVDPLKDMQAGIEGIGFGLASRTDLLAEQGLDFEEIAEQLAREKEIAQTNGIEISSPKPASAGANPQPAADENPSAGDGGARLDARRVGRLAAVLAAPRNGGSHR